MPKNVCIVGVGLIGGSLGMALRRVRKAGRAYNVTGFGLNPARLKVAKRRGAIDVAQSDRRRALKDADIVVLGMPVDKMAPFLTQNAKLFKRGAIITDVGSVKAPVAAAAKRLLSKRRDLSFVGGHPVAGSEKTGVENARPDLFKKATCVLTKDHASFHALEIVRAMWTSAGAHCLLMSAAEHDRWLALTSHLPHLLAFALFAQVAKTAQSAPIIKTLVGGSFRDMTRIAGADANLWTGVIETNRTELKRLIPEFQKELRALATLPAKRLHAHLVLLARAKQTW